MLYSWSQLVISCKFTKTDEVIYVLVHGNRPILYYHVQGYIGLFLDDVIKRNLDVFLNIFLTLVAVSFRILNRIFDINA